MRLGINGRFFAARPTGVQRYARELVAALALLTRPILFLPRGTSPEPDIAARVDVREGRIAGPLFEQLELPVAARRAGVDVLLSPANAAPILGAPQVVVLHDLLPLLRPRDYSVLYRIWVRVAHAAAARRAAAVITVSSWSADVIVDRLGIPSSRVTVARQGVAPLDTPASFDAVAAVRGRWGLEGPYFVTVTGADPRKGARFLDQLWREEWWPPGAAPRLVRVGAEHSGVHRASAEDEAVEGVLVLGHVSDDDLRALYTGSVALLHAAADEGFGRPPLEALACGTRALVAPYGPAREVLGDAADVVELDRAKWRKALRRLLAEPTGERARRVALGRGHATGYSWTETAERVLAVCEAVVRGADRASASRKPG